MVRSVHTTSSLRPQGSHELKMIITCTARAVSSNAPQSLCPTFHSIRCTRTSHHVLVKCQASRRKRPSATVVPLRRTAQSRVGRLRFNTAISFGRSPSSACPAGVLQAHRLQKQKWLLAERQVEAEKTTHARGSKIRTQSVKFVGCNWRAAALQRLRSFTLPNSTLDSGPRTFDERGWPQASPPTTARACMLRQ